MSSWLLFLFKSTVIFSVLYLAFRILMSRETFFRLNRITLLTIILATVCIPLAKLPTENHPVMSVMFNPTNMGDLVVRQSSPISNEISFSGSGGTKEVQTYNISLRSAIMIVYITGLLISLLFFAHGILSVLRIIKNARTVRWNGVDLYVTDKDIPAFSFKKCILISQRDMEDNDNSESIVAHEMSHIRLGHFYDLMIIELVKIIYWFNPFLFRMNRDLKDIHEFQADEDTLRSGIDSTRYQMLIIQKCVGHQAFALANSFNHCQIKLRIHMMNKPKTSKAWCWKVAIFLPLLAFLLMAFGKRGEVAAGSTASAIDIPVTSAVYQNNYDEFKLKIEIRKDGNYIDNKLVSLEEIAIKGKEWYSGKNEWIFLLADGSIPLSRIDEVRGALKHSYWIVQTTVNSDDLVYFAGDVNELARFQEGKFGDWISSQLKDFLEARKGKENIESKIALSYSYIIGKDGKVRDAHIIKVSGDPDFDAAYEKLLSQIPDWIPAKRAGKNVSVYQFSIGSLVSYTPPKR